MDDRLIHIRDNYFAGYYKRCLSLAEDLRSQVTELEKGEFQSLVLRATSALNKEKAQAPSGVSPLDIATIATVHFLAYWHSNTTAKRKHHLDQLRENLSIGDPIGRFLVACALCKEGSETDLSEALQVGGNGPMENELLHTMMLVLVNRSDLAQQASASLLSATDDAVMAKLASAVVSLLAGNYQEAYLTYGDIEVQCSERETSERDRSNGEASVLLLNGKAVANMQRSEWEEALEDLKRAQLADPKDVETIANLITCHKWLKQEEESQKYIELLNTLDPTHPMLIELNNLQQAFSSFRTLRRKA